MIISEENPFSTGRKFRFLFFVLCTFFVFHSNTAIAQKKAKLSDKEIIIEYAYTELEQSMKDGILYDFGKKNSITGEFVFDITIREKGKVVTVFAVSRNGEIKHQNKLKDALRVFKFNFVMPKGRKYKFQYKFKF